MQYKIFLIVLFLLTSCEGVEKKSVSPSEKEEFIEYSKNKNSIYFSANSTEIEDEGVRRVNEAIYNLSLVKNVKVILYGYSDRVGTIEHNKKLAERRVTAIKKAIEDSGIVKKNNLTIESAAFGEYDPLVSLNNVDNDPKSRRVDIFIVSKER